LLLYSSLSTGYSNPDADFRQRIGTAVQGRLADAKPLRLADINMFAWDRVAIFLPHTPRAIVEQTPGTSVPSGAVVIGEYGDVCLVVFLHTGKVTEWILLPCNLGGLSESGMLALFIPETAMFRVAAIDHGEPRILLILAVPLANSL